MGLEMKAKWAQGWSVPRHRLWCHRDHAGGPMGEWISALGLNISNCALRCAKQQSQLNSIKTCFSLRLHVYHGLTRGFCSPCQREGEGCGKPCSGNTRLPLPFPTHGTQQATQLQRVPGDRRGVQSHPVPRVAQNWNDVAKSTDHDKLFPKIITCNSEKGTFSWEVLSTYFPQLRQYTNFWIRVGHSVSGFTAGLRTLFLFLLSFKLQ